MAIILLLAVFLRFFCLGSVPEGFQSDEVAFGYNAYSILRTGKDEFGVPFPTTLRSYGDYKAALYSYLAVPFIQAFGLTEWSIRAPSAVFGVFFVFLVYLWGNVLFHDKRTSLIAASLAAISPVGIFLSRVQSDPLVAFVLFYAGFYALFKWLETQRIVWYALGVSFLFLSFLTYVVTRLFVLPMLVLFFLWQKRRATKKNIILYAALFIFVVAVATKLSFGTLASRMAQVNVFNAPGTQLLLDESIREDGVYGTAPTVTRIFHNKVISYARTLLVNASKYGSFSFLFDEAREPIRERVPGMGVLYLIELPFLLLGIYWVFVKKKGYQYLVYWMLLVPFVLSIAYDETPNIHRFFLAMLPIHLLTALGIVSVLKKPFLKVPLQALFVMSLVYYLHQLFVHQPLHEPINRSYAVKELSLILKTVSRKYDTVVSPKILGHILFYWQVDPLSYQNQGSPRDEDYHWFGNILFVPDECPSSNMNSTSLLRGRTILFVDKSHCPTMRSDTIQKEVLWKDGKPAYRLIERTIAI